MKLCAVDKKIQNIFVVTKLSLVFDVHDTEAQAVASFK
jgi:anti-anti-sigma regulatory factor